MNNDLFNIQISKLLDEYSIVCIELEKIRNKIIDFRNTTKDKLLSAKTIDEKRKIFLQFRKEIKNIKTDKSISDNYLNFKKQKNDIRTKIINLFQQSYPFESSNVKCKDVNDTRQIFDENEIRDADNDLAFLLNKYSFNDNNKNTYIDDIHYTPEHNQVNNFVKTFNTN